jgi:hypothetical protein
MKRIIYQNSEGGVSVIIPTESVELALNNYLDRGSSMNPTKVDALFSLRPGRRMGAAR